MRLSSSPPFPPRARHCRVAVAAVAGSLGFVLASFPASESHAAAEFRVPDGYAVVDLGFDNVDGFGVSADGRLVTAVAGTNELTVTLYDSYKTGRKQLGRVSVAAGAPLYATDLAFDGQRVVFGENRSTHTAYSIDFGRKLPTVSMLAPEGSLPGVQDVTVTGGNVLVSGYDAPLFAEGGLYLKTVPLAGGTPETVVGDVPNGYVGGAGVVPADGSYVLLDSRPALRRFDPGSGAELDEVSLAGGNGWSAYAVAFDAANKGYVTSGHTITLVEGLGAGGGASPAVSEFGRFVGIGSKFDRFLAGIEFTGGAFRAGHADDTGALIFADGTLGDEGLFAIVPVPEPTGVAVLTAGATLLLARRRRGGVR